MFNRERFKQLADQAIQAGNRLATQASATVQNAQHQIATRRVTQLEAGSIAPIGSDSDGAHLLGSNSGRERPSQSEETISALQRRNEILVRRLQEANGVLEENRQLKSKLEQLEVGSPVIRRTGPDADAVVDSALLDQAAAKIEQLQQELKRFKNAEASRQPHAGMHPAASESDMQALHGSLQLMQQELLAAHEHAAQLTSKLEAQQAQHALELRNIEERAQQGLQAHAPANAAAIEQLQAQLVSKNEEISLLQHHLEAVQQEVRNRNVSSVTHESARREYVSPMARTGSEVAAWEAASQGQRDAEVEALQAEVAVMQSQQLDTVAELDAVRTELAKVHAQRDAELQEERAKALSLQGQRERAVAAANAELAQAQAQRVKQDAELQAAQSALAKLQESQHQYLQELHSLREYREQHGSLHDAELASLQAELSCASARAAENEEIIRQLQTYQESTAPSHLTNNVKLASVMDAEQVAALQKQIAELQAAVAGHAQQRAELTETTSRLQARIAELESGGLQPSHEAAEHEARTPTAGRLESQGFLGEGLAQRLLQMESQLSSAARAASVAASPQGGCTPQATPLADIPASAASAPHTTPGGASLAEALLLRMERSISVAEGSIDTLRADLDASHHDNQRLQQEVDSLNSRLASLSHTGARLADAVHELPQDHPARVRVEHLADSLHSIAFPSPANPSTPTASKDVCSEFASLEVRDADAGALEAPQGSTEAQLDGGAVQGDSRPDGLARAERTRQAESEMARLKEELAQGYAQVEHAREMMHHLKLIHSSEIKDLRETLAAREKELAVQHEQHAAEHAVLTATVAQHAQRVQELEQQLACRQGLETELAAYAARAEELQQQLQVAEGDLSATSALVGELRVQLDSAASTESAALASLRRELESSKLQVATFQQVPLAEKGGQGEEEVQQARVEQEAASELAAVCAELHKLRPEAEELARRLAGAQEEVARSRDQMFAMQVQLEELADLRAQCADLAADKARAEAELAGAKEHADSAQSQVERLHGKVAELEGVREGAEAAAAELAAVQERCFAAEAAKGDAEERMRALEEAAQQASAHQQQVLDVQQQLEAARKAGAETHEHLAAAQQRCQELEVQLADAQPQLDSLKHREAAAQQELGSLQQQVAELQDSRDAAQHQAAQLNSQLGEVEALVPELRRQLAASEQQQAEQAQRLKEARHAGAQLQRQLAELQQEAAGMQPLAAEVAALRPELAAAQAQVAALQAQMHAAKQELGSLRPAAAELGAAKAEAASAHAALAQLRHLAEVELPAVRSELEVSRAGEEAARREAAALGQRADEAERQCSALHEAEERRRRDETTQREEREALLAASRTEWEGERAGLQQQLQASQSEVERLLAQLNKAKLVLANSKKAAAAAEAAAAAAAQQMEAAEAERTAALQAAEASKVALEELQAQLGGLEREAAEARAATHAVHEEIERLQPEADGAARACWPAAVRQLVERAEALAAESALADGRAAAEQETTRLLAEYARLEAASQQAAAAAAASEEGAAQARERAQQAERDLEEAAAAHAERVHMLEAQLAAAQAELEGWGGKEEATGQELRARSEALAGELEQVQRRLEEREEQLRQLQAELQEGAPRPCSPSSLPNPPATAFHDAPDAPLLSPGGTTVRFLAPLSYADVAPPQQLPFPPADLASGRARSPLVPPPASSLLPLSTGPLPPRHRLSGSISSEIEPLGDVGHLQEQRSERSDSLFASQLLPPHLQPSLETVGLDDSVALRARLASLEKEVADSERTHALRDTATAVLKEEIADMRRQMKRGDVDLDYVKNVVIGGFESGELPASSHMLPVLARLLQFSPAELQRIQSRSRAAAASGTSSSSLFKIPGFS